MYLHTYLDVSLFHHPRTPFNWIPRIRIAFILSSNSKYKVFEILRVNFIFFTYWKVWEDFAHSHNRVSGVGEFVLFEFSPVLASAIVRDVQLSYLEMPGFIWCVVQKFNSRCVHSYENALLIIVWRVVWTLSQLFVVFYLCIWKVLIWFKLAVWLSSK